MRGYKLFRQLKDGSISSLFINKTARLERGVWLKAHNYPTKGFAVRQGWHCCNKPDAPHLSKKNRIWFEVEMEEVEEFPRPKSQGGIWYIAQRIRICEQRRYTAI